MRRDRILIITRRDDIRDLFLNIIHNPENLCFAENRSGIRRAVQDGGVTVAIADHRISLASGAEILQWIREDQPYIHLILLQDYTDPIDDQNDRWIHQYVHLVPLPLSSAQARELIETFIEDEAEVVEDVEEEEEPEEEIGFKSDEKELIASINEFINNLPTLPVVVQKIISIIGRDNTIARDIAEVIALDVALSAKVLNLANSALYNLANPINTIEHAVALLGFNEVRNLAMGLKMVEAFPETDTIGLDRARFWEHSLACALFARYLADTSRKVSADEAFLGGLMHDLGKVVLDLFFEEQWIESQRIAFQDKLSPTEAEEKYLGAAHTVVGSWLAQLWKIPRTYQTAMLYHHELPPEDFYDPEDILFCEHIRVANVLVNWMGMGGGGYIILSHISKEQLEYLGIDEYDLVDIIQKTQMEMNQWKSILGLKIIEKVPGGKTIGGGPDHIERFGGPVAHIPNQRPHPVNRHIAQSHESESAPFPLGGRLDAVRNRHRP